MNTRTGPRTLDDAAERFARIKIGAVTLAVHLLCYVGIGLIALLSGDGPAGPIYAVLLFIVAFMFLGAGLGMTAKGLKQWHLACLPEESAPSSPTPAENMIKRSAAILKTLALMLSAGALGFYLSGLAGALVFIVPVFVTVCAIWYTITGVVQRPGISRSETREREAIWQQMPRIKYAQRRHERKVLLTIVVVVFMGPLFIIHGFIQSVTGGGHLEVVSRGVAGVVCLAILYWYVFDPKWLRKKPVAGLAQKFRMPGRKY